MSPLVTLQLIPERLDRLESPVQDVRASDASRSLHKAFVTLLAANVFVISATICFGLLYFSHE